MRIINKCFLSGLCVALGFTSPLHAATDTTTFDVTITITAACDISTGTNGIATLAFGSKDPFQANVAGQTDLKVTCTKGAPYDIGLDAGLNESTSDDVSTRRMKGITSTPVDNTGEYVPYNLFQDAVHSTVWGNTIDNDTVESTGTGAQQTFTIYGLVPSTNYTVGDYKDTVTATVTF
ncbi:spore coat U domain-containing protein [Advenella sp. RU8]|uniref:Csu type fimbrial protein n=1 Tax=Advenella sp. RU8 TaxID=3399575 RepID=UPI003AABA388